MTTDDDIAKLIARLREAKQSLVEANITVPKWDGSLYLEAADALEALRADGERWRMACELFADMGWKANVVVSIRCENEDCPDWHRTPTILRQIDAAIAAQEKL